MGHAYEKFPERERAKLKVWYKETLFNFNYLLYNAHFIKTFKYLLITVQEIKRLLKWPTKSDFLFREPV